ncbi:MAG: cation:proton antiporter [Synechococcaceae cyanobacterium RL_1_2]|nr:cation:proton antiporter [Synechococcaceae cyanobacterium RL_1_2]
MKWIYLAVGVVLYCQILVLTDITPHHSGDLVAVIAKESEVPSAVAGIILRNRLYDTMFEVVVFTIAIMGVKFLLANEKPPHQIYQLPDQPSIILARLGATITALVSVELALKGHLSPGGGFAAGVAGGTAIGLVAITSSPQWMDKIYKRWNAALLEKLSVIGFIAISIVMFISYQFPTTALAPLAGGLFIPLLNVIVALKVALGSWSAMILFIRYRGLF